MPRVRWDVLKHWQFVYTMSDRKLAHRMGFSASHFCDVKRGYRNPSAEFIDSLTEITRLSYDRILRHPSVKDDEMKVAHPEEGLTKDARGGSLLGLCRNQEHRVLFSDRDYRTVEREAAATIPQESRKQLWPRPKSWATIKT